MTRISSAPTTRRAILSAAGAALGSAALPALAEAPPPGRATVPALAAALDGLRRIDDGDPAGPRVRVLFSPLCPRSLALFEATRAWRMSASWAWVPFANGVPAQAMACQAALEDGTQQGLERCLRGTGGGAPDRWMAAQDRYVRDRVGRLFWDATNSALGTPSLVYVRRDGVVMAVRGALGAGRVADMLAAAA